MYFVFFFFVYMCVSVVMGRVMVIYVVGKRGRRGGHTCMYEYVHYNPFFELDS